VAFTTHLHIALRLKKEYSYTSTSPLGLLGLLQGEFYLYLYLTSYYIQYENKELGVKFQAVLPLAQPPVSDQIHSPAALVWVPTGRWLDRPQKPLLEG